MKKPTDLSLARFSQRWTKAQRKNNVKSMESMLTKKWINHWWWTMMDASNPQAKENCRSALERTLIKEGLIGDRPERPSERAMRLSTMDR